MLFCYIGTSRISEAEISLHNTNAYTDRDTNIEAISFVKGI